MYMSPEVFKGENYNEKARARPPAVIAWVLCLLTKGARLWSNVCHTH